MLKLYNTLTRTKEEFRPLDPANVRVYVCGPTVYDFAHIGNARPVIVFDVLYRLLRHLYGAGHVKYVRNITDVDDKINARAAEEYPALPLNEAIREVTRKTEAQFHEDVAALGCLKPDVEPRATEHIEEMKVLIERLIKNGCAYAAEGHVLFHVSAMKDYGKLANRSLDEMLSGARVEVAPYKRDPMDFVLWKPSKPGEPAWPSPAGISAPGRPGWHIECSAMSWKHLGEQFDIHGGGIDLVFPHHENELAQSRCAFHSDRMAQVWMHNGFLQVESAKMSKSLGNFVTIRELRKSKRFGGREWSGPLLKFAMLQTHYRQPLDWTTRLLEQSEVRLERWLRFAAERTRRRENEQLMNRFVEALADDLNTPAAFAIIDEVVDEEKGSEEDRFTVYKMLLLVGIKTRKTRVVRAVEALSKHARDISRVPSSTWQGTIDTLNRGEAASQRLGDAERQMLFFSALTLLRDDLGLKQLNHSLDSLNLWNIHSSDGVSRKRGEEKSERRFHEVLRLLGHFSRNDWTNIISTVRRRPTFESGKLKPETLLVAYLNSVADFCERWNSQPQNWPKQFVQLRNQYLHEAKPAENLFDVRVRRLIAERDVARKDRDYGKSDRIRDELAKMGVIIKDTPEGTTWEVAR